MEKRRQKKAVEERQTEGVKKEQEEENKTCMEYISILLHSEGKERGKVSKEKKKEKVKQRDTTRHSTTHAGTAGYTETASGIIQNSARDSMVHATYATEGGILQPSVLAVREK